MFSPVERLDRRKHDFGIWIFCLPCVVAQASLRSDAAEGVQRLVENFLAMRNKQHSPELGTACVKSGEPCLSETCCEDHQAGLVSGCACLLQRSERLSLDSRRRDWRLCGLWSYVCGFDDWSLNRSPAAVRGHPLCGELG